VSELADQLVAGIEAIGANTMALMRIAMYPTVPKDVRQEIADIASVMAEEEDRLRTLARTVP
jgi:hypothetical protein